MCIKLIKLNRILFSISSPCSQLKISFYRKDQTNFQTSMSLRNFSIDLCGLVKQKSLSTGIFNIFVGNMRKYGNVFQPCPWTVRSINGLNLFLSNFTEFLFSGSCLHQRPRAGWQQFSTNPVGREFSRTHDWRHKSRKKGTFSVYFCSRCSRIKNFLCSRLILIRLMKGEPKTKCRFNGSFIFRKILINKYK